MAAHPNIFKYATSELSQDAFLAWLLAWADHRNRRVNEQLWEAGSGFLRLLFERHGRAMDLPPEPAVRVWTQRDRIDVLAVVNERFHVLIEDKVGTRQHSDQLVRYKEALRARKVADDHVLPIYVQTHEQASYDRVARVGFEVVRRTDLLTLLRPYRESGGANAIALDFLRHLEELHAEFEAWKHRPTSESWGGNTWLGFLAEVQGRLDPRNARANWRYVANARGGFYGLWWKWIPLDLVEAKLYLQLENRGADGKLTFRIYHPEKAGRRKARDTAHKAIKEAAGREVRKPKRFGAGETMTFAVLEVDYRATQDNGVIAWEPTLARLERAEEILEDTARILRTRVSGSG